jgi:hypothetical protein
MLVWLGLSSGGEPADVPPSPVAEPETSSAHVPDRPVGHTSDACHAPMPWRIAAVDPRFGLEEDELGRVIEEAVRLWEDAVGRPLFSHDPEEGFPIRFLFDERQQRTLERIRHTREFEALDRELGEIRRELREQRGTLDRERNLFLRSASTDGRDASIRRSGELRERTEALEVEEIELEARIRERNERAAELERLFPPTPVESGSHRAFTEYHPELGSRILREIRIYRFDDEEDLVHIVAHELGHALGLEHLPFPEAVMSAKYGGAGSRPERLAIHPLSLERLREICGEAWD